MNVQQITFGKKSLIVLLASGSLLLSCKKNDEKVVTTDDAADVVSYALESSSGGTADQLKECTAEANDQAITLDCGSEFDTTVSASYNGTVTGAYTTQRQYVLACTNQVAESIHCTGTYSGNFDAPRMSSSNSGGINWTLTGLESSAANYVFNGSLNRSGTHSSKVRNKYTFNTTMSITSSNIQVNKTTGKVVSGSGSVTLSCAVDGGGTYDFTGTIVYNANETATLTINGSTYTITLY